jgi:hypothetical protein
MSLRVAEGETIGTRRPSRIARGKEIGPMPGRTISSFAEALLLFAVTVVLLGLPAWPLIVEVREAAAAAESPPLVDWERAPSDRNDWGSRCAEATPILLAAEQARDRSW